MINPATETTPPDRWCDMPSETKFAAVDLQHVDADGTFAGYASLFGKPDLGKDVVVRGAFTASLKRRGAKGIKMLFQHDPNQPIGVWDQIEEDEKGLCVSGRLMPDVARAREVLSLMRAGALDGLSIGFRTVMGGRDARTGVRHLKEIDLWEISVVTFPMHPDARISTVKKHPFHGGVPSERDFERWLTRDAGLTRSQARTLMRSGFKPLACKLAAAGGCDPEHRLVSAMTRASVLLDPTRRRKFI